MKGLCRAVGSIGILACTGGFAVLSEAEPASLVVTATRLPAPADEIPAFISVVSGSDLSARGATDMAAALSLVPGVEAPPGGDAGPSSAVLSLWGLHEFDAFLLVVDQQSLSVDGRTLSFADSREHVSDGRALYRGCTPSRSAASGNGKEL